MADRDRNEGYGSDRDRWRDRDREPGWRADDERRSWRGEDYGRGRHREGGTYGQGAWRGAGQRSLQHEDQRYGPHRDTGETWGQGRSYRDQMGREDFGQYGRTGGGGDYDYGYGREQRGQGDPESGRQFGRGGYGEGGSRVGGDYAGASGGAFGAGGYGAYADAGNAGGAVGSRLYGGFGHNGMGQTYGQSGYGQSFGSTGRDMGGGSEPAYGQHEHGGHDREGRSQPQAGGHGMSVPSSHGDFEPDYLHWRNTQMQTLDQDYLRWREERRSRFAKDFDDWRRSQGGPQGQQSTTSPMQTAGQGSTGGVSSEQDRPGTLATPTVDRMASGETGQHAHGRDDKKKS